MVRIAGTGHYVPAKVLSNNDLEKMVDTNDEWIIQRTGIKNRRIVEDEVTSDLATKAGQKALEAAGMKPEDIDLIILGTSTPDYHIPSCAPIVQHKLGCRMIPAFDINSVCTSFMCGLTTAYSMIASGLYKNCLLIGADTYSKILNWKDRNTCVIFGDGAGAVVLVKDDNAGKLLSTDFGSDGSGSDYIKIPVGGVVNPINNFYGYKEEDLFFQMAGKKVYEFTISVVPEAARRMLRQANLTNETIDHVIVHQANVRIIDTISKMVDIDRKKFIVNIEKYGNTSSASIPIALDEAVRHNIIKKGETVMMLGFGGGLSWGGVVFQW
ncbi:MAG: hypothetical protein A2015_16420 [Spirochaetes bacterium GWF1_31_7]|nr:MAG: hypothetical protein A2Y30_13785 [Spirochaetes bacterium GWE1_32_154]OHD50030.1 MAG: hypothetical protein A2Y29_11830 [Spirochaetes bacterium GWE2_31_10]OHD52344.1 MAG: hypothetical protein A2015_16420 [Spirochaetes bacterium GWF1_31_7]OHD82683.1 MAG: hypothetical protein A2355_16195 [Spirochaetes bacterium RIFOXYB1_FULL_32_8]HBI38495.1 3-oxoacyl-ACP synthase [Spirochaetia bacterium]